MSAEGENDSKRLLYKYYSYELESQYHNVEQNQFYFSSCLEFNDPFDGWFSLDFETATPVQKEKKVREFLLRRHPEVSSYKAYELSKKLVRREIIGNKSQETKRKMVEFNRVEREEVGICCFSESRDNILMWSHYASKHTGICVGYDFINLNKWCDLIHDKGIPIVGRFKVIYSINYEKCKFWECDGDSPESIIATHAVKAKDWVYEKEHRILIRKFAGNLLKYPSSLVREVIFGCKSEDATVTNLKQAMQATNPNIDFYKAKQSRDQFALDFIDI